MLIKVWISITILIFGHIVSFMRYGQFKIIWFPLSCHHLNRTISLSYYSQFTYENVLKYIYPLKEIVSLSRGPRDHESQGDNFESLGHCWYYLGKYFTDEYPSQNFVGFHAPFLGRVFAFKYDRSGRVNGFFVKYSPL